ncbi:2-dehydro-3-deoxygalactonokinase [Alkalibacter saccharofermentans]|uniref:2-dehydro-3-deoxygalactonokinase n=1 Tax=Alkalibacter saccharofermentans DSM 14828 TaxID=1120975 RepID=A0A1M4WHN8_9FIRM|nr:2-dehydro-3-deoxygalactonokinase [Alkalibacter saccharofermentans]SHE80715.1 2-dehydro-3-deoxygalactonokinase [Alkalibacter saccharofermentans DSM 14828]
MKKYNITIDTGTTNTRTILWNEEKTMLAVSNSPVGVRNTAIDGNNHQLKAAVKRCLLELLETENIGFDDIGWVIASGMITSNVGLVEIPHLVAPAGIKDLVEAIEPVLLEEICPLPIWFIPGVKNSGDKIDVSNFEAMDIMRGEEVESCAIIDGLHDNNKMLLVLPGSHTKFVAVDENGNMTGCLTSIAGELISSITNNTIIADAVGRKFVQEDTYNQDMLLLGYETAKKVGLGRTCFSARILNLFAARSNEDMANFILGAVLQDDVAAIKASDAVKADGNTTVVVSGKNPLQQALLDIFEHDNSFAKVVSFTPEGNMPLSAVGAYLIAEQNKSIREVV